ncbi:MAG: hypothetical protein R6W82_03325 [bacterium]
MRTDAEHRALDERLDLLNWGLVLVVIALILLIPGRHHLWYYLVPVGLVFIGMSVVRKLIPTRRDTAGLILGLVAVLLGVLDLVGVDLQFFPLMPLLFAIVGIGLMAVAFVTNRIRRDPDRPAD